MDRSGKEGYYNVAMGDYLYVIISCHYSLLVSSNFDVIDTKVAIVGESCFDLQDQSPWTSVSLLLFVYHLHAIHVSNLLGHMLAWNFLSFLKRIILYKSNY